MTATWRDIARPIIAQVIEQVGVTDPRALRHALRAAYPFGPREYHPYRIWCHEIRVQLGQTPAPNHGRRTLKPAAGQRTLF